MLIEASQGSAPIQFDFGLQSLTVCILLDAEKLAIHTTFQEPESSS